MKRPIIFTEQMVSAILNGSKTITRRPVGFDKVNECPDAYMLEAENLYVDNKGRLVSVFLNTVTIEKVEIACKYGNIGDILYVKEPYKKELDGSTIYKQGNSQLHKKWIPGMYMPYHRSRIWLKIIDINPERLSDITVNSAIKEGAPLLGNSPQKWFYEVWDKIYGDDKNKQTDNDPWLWVIEFEIISTTGVPSEFN